MVSTIPLYYATQLPSPKEFVPNSSGRQWVEGTLGVSCGDEDSGVKQGWSVGVLHLLAPSFARGLAVLVGDFYLGRAWLGYVLGLAYPVGTTSTGQSAPRDVVDLRAHSECGKWPQTAF